MFVLVQYVLDDFSLTATPRFNFVNHKYHGTDTSKYYKE